jgi:hypothetical protein
MKYLFLLLFATQLFSVPTPPTLEELISKSDYIAKTKLTKIRETKLNKYSTSVNAIAQIQTVYKEKTAMPSSIDLAFMVLPEFYGKWLKMVPAENEYILFYVQKEFKNSKGNTTNSIILYEPHVFAFKEVTNEIEEKLKSLKKE